MRRNRKNSIKKERVIMVASSAFVLAALTLTGVYMNGQNEELQDDGYTLDFTELENNADDKLEEIAQNEQIGDSSTNPIAGEVGNSAVQNSEYSLTGENTGMQSEITEDDLDYMPLEVGSGQIQIPGLTDGKAETGLTAADKPLQAAEEPLEAIGEPLEAVEDLVEAVIPERALSFTAESGLLRPVSGEILMHYSMNSSIYFATLDQYKYNPAVILAAAEGTAVSACAPGKVVNIYDDAKTGKTVVLDLGSGYQATYGQLTAINVEDGTYVDEGDIIASVAAPTKYYSVEGSNLYFALAKDGVPVNPEAMFR